MRHRILIVDDEPLVRASLRRLLRHPEWELTDVGSGEAACECLAHRSFDLAIIDYKLGEMNGLEVLDALRERSPDTVAILLTAYGNVSMAVEAIKKGAYDFLQKDGDPALTRHVVEKALEKARLRREIERLREERLAHANLPQFVCRNPAMQRILQMTREFARTDATVLIEGETGTGKSLIAEYIHFASERSDGPFVTINCGAIPKELIESELFGYAEGAFTGAKQKGKIGLIKRADGGTLFLDEIGDLSLDLQSKLLHVLEKREFLSVGSVEPTRVDVRFVAATNADLAERIATDRFRRDLYYRLNVAAIRLPPLRERRDEILPLATHFIHCLNQQLGKSVTAIAPDAERLLLDHDWPGNVRELHNVLERAMLLKRGDTIEAADLAGLCGAMAPPARAGVCVLEIDFAAGGNVLEDVVRQVVLQAWERSGRNQTQAARLLNIPRTTFQTYVQKYGL